MTYEVHFQLADAQYTVRGPDIDGVLLLIQGVQAIPPAQLLEPYAPADNPWIDWAGGSRPGVLHGPERRCADLRG